MASSDGGGEEERIPVWASVQVAGWRWWSLRMNVRCPRHCAACACPASRPITLLMRRPGSGAEVAGGCGSHDGALGGRVNAVGTARSARAKVAMSER